VALPGRYVVDAIEVEATGPGRLTLSQVAVHDAAMQRTLPVSLPAAYLSETRRFAETAVTPRARLYEVTGSVRAWVAGRVRPEKDDEAVLRALANLTTLGIDPRREVLMTRAEADAARAQLPDAATGGRADILRATPEGLDVRAAGPGLLVVAEAWDRGWTAEVDDRPAPVLRVNHAEAGVPLGPGVHRVLLRYQVPGLWPGVGLALAGLALLGLEARRRRPADG
jgi:hypothetical protein